MLAVKLVERELSNLVVLLKILYLLGPLNAGLHQFLVIEMLSKPKSYVKPSGSPSAG